MVEYGCPATGSVQTSFVSPLGVATGWSASTWPQLSLGVPPTVAVATVESRATPIVSEKSAPSALVMKNELPEAKPVYPSIPWARFAK